MVDTLIVQMLENLVEKYKRVADQTELYETLTEFMEHMINIQNKHLISLKEVRTDIMKYIEYVPDLQRLNTTIWSKNFDKILYDIEENKITQLKDLEL